MSEQQEAVFRAIDAANEKEPEQACLVYGHRMSQELSRLFGDGVSDVLKIAARGQHIERWLSKRTDYPEGRAGYLKWRKDLGRFHGDRLAVLMHDAGYPQEDCDRVGVLLRKEGLKRDAEVQALEDTICIVFMKYYFDGFAAKHAPEKILDIVTKTARKMSDATRLRVLEEFDLPPAFVDVVRPAPA